MGVDGFPRRPGGQVGGTYLRSAVEPRLAEFVLDTARLNAAGDTIRTRFIKAVAAGACPKATAEAMGLPYRKAKRWVEVWRETGAVTKRKFGKVSKLDEHEDFLRQLVAERPTIKLAEIHDVLDRRDVKTSKTAVWNAPERFGIELADRDARQVADVQKLLADTWKSRKEFEMKFDNPPFAPKAPGAG